MKSFSLLCLLCLCCVGAFGQGRPTKPASYTIVFDEDGKIESSSIPQGIYPTRNSDSTARFDVSKLSYPVSNFVESVKKLEQLVNRSATKEPKRDDTKKTDGRLNKTPVITTKTFADSLYKEFGDTIKNKLFKLESTQVWQYDTTNALLPITNAVDILPNLLSGGESVKTSGIRLGKKEQEIDYAIVAQRLDNQIVVNHLNKTKGLYKGWSVQNQLLVDTLRELYTQYGAPVSLLLRTDSLRCQTNGAQKGNAIDLPFNIDVVRGLSSFYPYVCVASNFYEKVLRDNRNWIKHWLWYTGGDIRLNPFVVTDPAPLLIEAEQQSRLVEKRLALLQQYTTCCEDGRLDYEKAQAETNRLTARLEELRNRAKNLVDLTETYKKWLANASVQSKVMYKGTLTGSKPGNIMWAHHYDAADGFQFNTEKDQLPDMVADMDQVVVVVHNVKDGDTVSVRSTEVAFTPKTKLELGLNAFSDVFAEAFKSLIPAGKFGNLIAGVIGKSTGNKLDNGNNNFNKVQRETHKQSERPSLTVTKDGIKEALSSYLATPLTYATNYRIPAILKRLPRNGNQTQEELKDILEQLHIVA